MADKRITEVDFIDSLNSNESFFVNQNNAIKQINKNDIVVDVANGGTGVNTITADSYIVGNGVNAVVEKTPDEVWSHIKSAGKTVSTGTNAEIFNDYIGNQATGDYSHAEGDNTTASGNSSHAEGTGTAASGDDSHAEGTSTTASGWSSHAEGEYTIASGLASHAEGVNTQANETCSHAEGGNTIADSKYSHAEGNGTVANQFYQHVQGRYNNYYYDNDYAHVVGNGEDDDNRSNAHTLDWEGNAWFAGDIYIGGTGQGDGSVLAKFDDINPFIFKLLWTNESPNDGMGETTLTIPNLTNYNVIKMLLKRSDTHDGYVTVEFIVPFTDAMFCPVSHVDGMNGSWSAWERNFTINRSENTISMANGSYSQSGSVGYYESVLRPLYIWGCNIAI